MCYSAQVYAAARKYRRLTGADISNKEFAKLFFIDQGKNPHRKKRPKVARATEIDFLVEGPEEIAASIREWDAQEMAELEQELFKQKKRVADGERALQVKTTKKAQDDVRIGTDKMAKIQARIDALKRREPKPSDNRMFPGYYVPVLVMEDGNKVVKPMRYQCRPAGKPAFYDTKYPGTYNARRDNLEGFWKGEFGHCHGLIMADVFYENVEVDGKNQVLAFTPKNGEPMYIACLWSHWTDPKGEEEDLLSFAAITDEPEPEVAAAGHDRTIINIKPEHVDAWLTPEGRPLAEMYAIFDDKQHPYYEHQVAKAA
jgi:putative SOS response-associated peptidase YedK